MKKVFILASAAIVALASCAKTQVVYNDAPEQIAFKTVDMPMTKAAYTANLGVSAYFVSTDAKNGTPYFEHDLFSLSSGKWTGTQYWPLSDALGFVAYGPGTDCCTTTTEGEKPVTTSTTGISAIGVKKDVDFVYSGYETGTDGKGYTKSETAVLMTLYHAKSKIVINVTNGSNEAVTNVELLAAGATGNCTVTFGAENSVVWQGVTTGDFDFSTNKTHYVIPGTQASVKITYNSEKPAVTGLTTTLNLAEYPMKDSSNATVDMTGGWKAGYSYEYNITISSGLITVDATETGWTEIHN